MDELAKKYFHKPAIYRTAMQLLAEHEIADSESSNFIEYENLFLSDLDDDEDKLLKLAIDYKHDLAKETQLRAENSQLKQELTSLRVSRQSI